ncbi:MAG: hypothetical protein OEM43_00470 [Gammaproteobacteria bacterium]|nr:hypothetical protein [Gammaproteobacteria bacterium]
MDRDIVYIIWCQTHYDQAHEDNLTPHMELQIPELKKPGMGTFKTGTGAVRQWIENLPLTNVDKTITLIEGALDEINGYILPNAERFEALELFARPVAHINDSLKKKYLGRPIPVKGSALVHAQKAIDICLRMATGYKILAAILDRAGEAGPQMATAIQRAIRYYSEILISNYQTYAQFPTGIWGDLHALYVLAEKHGLATHAVTDITTQHEITATLEDIYKQILLLSLACPYRLRQNEIRQVYDLLSVWAPHSKLLNSDTGDTGGFFACQLDTDEPPSYKALQQTERADSHCKLLSTRDMADPVNATLSEYRSARQHLGLPEEKTLQRLLMSWGVMPKRRFTRHRQDDEVRLLLGLENIHGVIAGPSNSTETGRDSEDHTIRDNAYLRDPTFEQSTSFDVDWLTGIDASPNGQAKDAARNQAHPGSVIRTPDKSPIEIWKLQDSSAGGYSLLWDTDTTSGAQVGELVAINTKAENDENRWHLGVIRWMKSTRQQGLEMGIQMLAPGACAIQATICNEKSSVENKMNGILLPEIKALNQPATLLLPSLPFRVGCTTALQQEKIEERIKLTQQLENTGCFAQFLFAPAEDA